MKKIFFKLIRLPKRERFVFFVILLSLGLFFSEFFYGLQFLIMTFVLSVLTGVFLFLSLRADIRGTFWYPIFILPFFYTVAFALFYSLVPARLLSRIVLTGVYAFGLYSLFLTQNIFAVSGIRTINLLRSARIVSLVLTIITFFFLANVSFSSRPPFYLLPIFILLVSFLLNFQSQWMYVLDKSGLSEALLSASIVSISLFEFALVLLLWPIDAAIYSIFLTGMFYTYSGLFHAWHERRLFKGVLLEYVWVGILSILLLILFANWGF